MCQPVTINVAAATATAAATAGAVVVVVGATVLFGPLLLLSAEEAAAAKVNSFDLAKCKETVLEFRATYCYGVGMAAEKPPAPANSNRDTARRRRDTDAVLQTGDNREVSTNEPKESLREQNFLRKFSESYKRNPIHRPSKRKLNKASWERTEDLLGFNVSNEELADIYNGSAAREPRNLRRHCTAANQKKMRKMMNMFAKCCPDLEKCFEHREHVKACYYHYKTSCHID